MTRFERWVNKQPYIPRIIIIGTCTLAFLAFAFGFVWAAAELVIGTISITAPLPWFVTYPVWTFVLILAIGAFFDKAVHS